VESAAKEIKIQYERPLVGRDGLKTGFGSASKGTKKLGGTCKKRIAARSQSYQAKAPKECSNAEVYE
jgi:hypothetical protein